MRVGLGLETDNESQSGEGTSHGTDAYGSGTDGGGDNVMQMDPEEPAIITEGIHDAFYYYLVAIILL